MKNKNKEGSFKFFGSDSRTERVCNVAKNILHTPIEHIHFDPWGWNILFDNITHWELLAGVPYKVRIVFWGLINN